MPGLGVGEHAVERQGLDLPLPPIAPAPAGPIGRARPLQHHAFDAALACGLPQLVEPFPAFDCEGLAQPDPLGPERVDDLRHRPPPLLDRTLAEVLGAPLEQVVGDEGRGSLGEFLRAEHLPPDPRLQRSEVHGEVVVEVPAQDFTVEDHPVLEPRPGLDQIGESLGQVLVLAAPQEDLALPLDELPPDAVPLPLRGPVGGVAEFCLDMPGLVVDFLVGQHGRGEEEGVGAAAVGVGGVGVEDLRDEGCGGRPVAHQALRDDGLFNAHHLRDRPLDERSRHPDPHRPRQRLHDHEELGPAKPGGPLIQPRRLLLGAEPTQRQEPALDPLGQPHPPEPLPRLLRPRPVHQQRDRLRQVPHRRVGLIEEPLRKPRPLPRPRPERPGLHQALDLLTRHEGQAPCGVLRRCLGEVGLQSRDLGVGRGRAVELVVEPGEALHASSSALNSVLSTSASIPCSRRCLARVSE